MKDRLYGQNVSVSVVIPFFSHLGWLKEAVNSVLAQTFIDYEIIVINDGSSEDMTGFLPQFGEKIIYIEKRNLGPASARNTGIELAKGKYIAFLDADDFWSQEKLAVQVQRMEETGAFWSHTDWETFVEGQKGKGTKRVYSDCEGLIFPRSLIATRIATPTVMIRSDILKQRKDLRFCEEMRFGQDYYLWLLMSAEFPLERIPQSLCFVRLRGNNANARARVHLQLRRNIWAQITMTRRSLFYRERRYFPIRWVYRMCLIGDKTLSVIEKKIQLNEESVEFLAKILYSLPYCLFSVLKLFFPVKKMKVSAG